MPRYVTICLVVMVVRIAVELKTTCPVSMLQALVKDISIAIPFELATLKPTIIYLQKSQIIPATFKSND